MELHNVAVQKGVLSPGHLARQLQQQLQVTAAGDRGHSSRPIFRYNKKHKTEVLPKLSAKESEPNRRKSFNVSQIMKTSLIGKLSIFSHHK